MGGKPVQGAVTVAPGNKVRLHDWQRCASAFRSSAIVLPRLGCEPGFHENQRWWQKWYQIYALQVVVVEGAYLWHSLGQWVELRRMLAGLLYVDAGEAIIGAQVCPAQSTANRRQPLCSYCASACEAANLLFSRHQSVGAASNLQNTGL
jgi:hypothetical protein